MQIGVTESSGREALAGNYFGGRIGNVHYLDWVAMISRIHTFFKTYQIVPFEYGKFTKYQLHLGKTAESESL